MCLLADTTFTIGDCTLVSSFGCFQRIAFIVHIHALFAICLVVVVLQLSKRIENSRRAVNATRAILYEATTNIIATLSFDKAQRFIFVPLVFDR